MPSRPAEKGSGKWRVAYYGIWATIGGLLLAAAAAWVLWRVSGAFAPFVIAFLFVVALRVPVARLSHRGMSRSLATGICFLVSLLVLVVITLFIVPPVSRQIVEFVNHAPGYLQKAGEWFLQAQQQAQNIVVPGWVHNAVVSIADSLSGVAVRAGNIIATGVVSAGSGLAGGVFNLFIGAVIAFWMLKDLPKMREEISILVGEKYEADFEMLASTIGRMVGGYVKGQTVASLVTGTLAGIGLALIGVPYAAVLGIITFVSNYIPYVGPFVSGLLAAVIGLFVSPWVAVGAVVVVLVAQNLTDAVVTPRVMSEQVNLHPILVIFSLLIGGSLFGFWGMIFSIPVAATLKALFVYYYENRTRRTLATEDGAFFKSAAEDGKATTSDDKAESDAEEAESDAETDGRSDAEADGDDTRSAS